MSMKNPLKKISAVFYSLRDFLWGYPRFVIRSFKSLRKYIVFIITLGLGFYFTIVFTNQFDKTFISSNKVLNEAYILSTDESSALTINPLITTNSQLEKDLTALIYLPLFKIDQDGKLTYKLAKGYTVSEDCKSYTFILRDDVWWHNLGNNDYEKFDADDVVYTFTKSQKAKDLNISVRKDSEYKVVFTIPQESPLLLEQITTGILPEHVWSKVDDGKFQFYFRNKAPIGTGPYKLISMDDNQIILERNEQYFGDKPKLQEIHIHFFSDIQSTITEIKRGKIDSILNPPEEIKDIFEEEYTEYQRYSKTIYRNTKVIFLNMREQIRYDDETDNVLSNTDIRQALSMYINRNELLSTLHIEGDTAIGPINKTSWAFDENINYYDYNPDSASKSLMAIGYKLDDNSGYWKQNDKTLSLTVTFLDNKSNNLLVKALQEQYKSHGIELVADPKPYDSLTNEILPLRNFQMLIFEIETGLDPDCFNWFDSNATEHPMLNLSGYSNTQTDRRLITARTTIDRKERKEMYSEALDYLMYDMPVIYLYHPEINYYVKKKITNIDLSLITIAQERFDTVSKWDMKQYD